MVPTGPGITRFEDAPDHPEPAGTIVVHAGLPVAAGVHASDLGGGVRWIDAHGHRSAGYARELTLACPEDRDGWVTELREPLADTP